MDLFAGGVHIETPITAPEPFAKRRQAVGAHAPQAEEKSLPRFLQQKPVARPGCQWDPESGQKWDLKTGHFFGWERERVRSGNT